MNSFDSWQTISLWDIALLFGGKSAVEVMVWLDEHYSSSAAGKSAPGLLSFNEAK